MAIAAIKFEPCLQMSSITKDATRKTYNRVKGLFWLATVKLMFDHGAQL
jgi:hypothetical protein